MEDEQKVVNERDESQDVRVVCVTLAAVHERPELVHLDQPEDPQDGLEPEGQIEEV